MSRILLILLVLAISMAVGVPQASAGTGNGDSHSYKWLRDADGDGIPNGLDEDWVRPLDGSGHQMKYGFGSPLNGLFLVSFSDGNLLRKQYRYRYDPSDPVGDGIRLREQLRDGSCK
jgi:hypothetical protein